MYAPRSIEIVCACCGCGKIRENGEWVHKDPNSYDQEHVSHGICPACVADLYPEYVHALAS